MANAEFDQVVGAIKDLVSDDKLVQQASRAFALGELKLQEIPAEGTPQYDHYWELVSVYITKALLQAAQDQRRL